MAIRIKSAKIHAMAKELASLTGKTQVRAIATALENQLARVRAAKGDPEFQSETDRDEQDRP